MMSKAECTCRSNHCSEMPLQAEDHILHHADQAFRWLELLAADAVRVLEEEEVRRFFTLRIGLEGVVLVGL
jgi:hypothetical protein